MNNSPVKFKSGLLANIPSNKTEGTIYVTTDEKGMYVDVSDSERIRIDGTLVASDDNAGNVEVIWR